MNRRIDNTGLTLSTTLLGRPKPFTEPSALGVSLCATPLNNDIHVNERIATITAPAIGPQLARDLSLIWNQVCIN